MENYRKTLKNTTENVYAEMLYRMIETVILGLRGESLLSDLSRYLDAMKLAV